MPPTMEMRIFCKIVIRGLKQVVALLEKYLRGDLKEDQL
jgi:hypothetical protein